MLVFGAYNVISIRIVISMNSLIYSMQGVSGFLIYFSARGTDSRGASGHMGDWGFHRVNRIKHCAFYGHWKTIIVLKDIF